MTYTVRRAPRLPGLNVDAIDLDAMISPRAHDSPVDGFLSDGLVGLGLGVQKGVEALVLGVATGLFESLQ